MEQSWIVAAGAGALLLVAVTVWLVARSRRNTAGEGEPDAPASDPAKLTEPTLEPVTDASTAEADDGAESLTDPAMEAAASETPDLDPAAEDEPYTLPDLDEEEALPSVETDVAEAAEEAAPDTPEITDPAFLSAREAFVRELVAGHFSKLDVFVAYEEAMKQPGTPEIPRSEFFHRVVNEALATRDAFEALLTDTDRERFVDIHSRYLDEVTEETDAEARDRLHREHEEKLVSLQPRVEAAVPVD